MASEPCVVARHESIGPERAKALEESRHRPWHGGRPAFEGYSSLVAAPIEAARSRRAFLRMIPQLLRDDEVRSGRSFEDRLEYRKWLASQS